MPEEVVSKALIQHANKEDEVQIGSGYVKRTLYELIAFPDVKRFLYPGNGSVRSFANVYLNEEDMRCTKGEEAPLRMAIT